MAILYRHIRLDKNEPFYIGIGLDYNRAYCKKKRSNFWRNIVSKTEYDIEILMDNLTWEEVCEKEREFIKLYGRKDLNTGTLVNLTDGGDGIFNLSKEARYRIGKGNRGIPRTKEIKEKISLKTKGRKPSKDSILRGIETKIKNGTIKRSDETKLKLVLANNKAVIGWKSKDLSDLVEYPSIKKAQEETGIKCISRVCNGHRKKAGKYFWKFK